MASVNVNGKRGGLKLVPTRVRQRESQLDEHIHFHVHQARKLAHSHSHPVTDKHSYTKSGYPDDLSHHPERRFIYDDLYPLLRLSVDRIRREKA